jgi:hypothetical protein
VLMPVSGWATDLRWRNGQGDALLPVRINQPSL